MRASSKRRLGLRAAAGIAALLAAPALAGAPRVPAELVGEWMRAEAAKALLSRGALDDRDLDSLRITSSKLSLQESGDRAARLLRPTSVDAAAKTIGVDGDTWTWDAAHRLHHGSDVWVRIDDALPAAVGLSAADVVLAAALSDGFLDGKQPLVTAPAWERNGKGRAWFGAAQARDLVVDGHARTVTFGDEAYHVHLERQGVALKPIAKGAARTLTRMKDPPFRVLADALLLRAAPDGAAPVVATLFFGATVRVWGAAAEDKQEGHLHGRWYLVQRQGKLGWAFGPFLARQVPPFTAGKAGRASTLLAPPDEPLQLFAGASPDDPDELGCFAARLDVDEPEFVGPDPWDASEVRDVYIERMDFNKDDVLDPVCLARRRADVQVCPIMSSRGEEGFVALPCVTWTGKGLPALSASDVNGDGFSDLSVKGGDVTTTFPFRPELGDFVTEAEANKPVKLDDVLARVKLADKIKKNDKGEIVRIALGGAGIQIHRLPADLFDVASLRSLWVPNGELRDLPKAIGKLKNLRELVLDHNRLERLPDTIGELHELRSLDVSNNALSALPASTASLAHLDKLNLSANHFATLPAVVPKLAALTRLRMSDNQLRELPRELAGVDGLREVDLSRNPLGRVPGVLCQLDALDRLTLDETGLSAVPACLFDTEVTDLSLARNPLTALPAVPSGHGLRRLDLSHDRFTQLPSSVLALPKLVGLYFTDNPLEELPAALAASTTITDLVRYSCSKKKGEALKDAVERCTRKRYRWK